MAARGHVFTCSSVHCPYWLPRIRTFALTLTLTLFVTLTPTPTHPALSSMSRWLLPTAPSSPPQLDAVDGLANRLYHSKSRDIPYAALQGDEVVPQRSNVLYITGWCYFSVTLV